MKVQDQSQLGPGCSQVGEHLRDVLVVDRLDCFELDEQTSADDQVQPMLSHELASVEDLLDRLLREWNISMRELDRERSFVHGFEESRPQCPVYFDGGAD